MPARRPAILETSHDARERIVDAAYELFSRRGIRGVGVDEVIDHAGVAKATLYRHFASKDDLVLAFLERREQRWTYGWLEAEAKKRASTPRERLLAIFDVFDDWFRGPDFDACSFINALLEMGPDHPVGAAGARHLASVRTVVKEFAEDAGIDDPETFAHLWHILMKGSIVAAVEGDRDAARRAKDIAWLLLDEASG